ncbi:MAG: nucleoside deaminase [Marinilabiliaceae bacterium]|nr:nucleoside deaminase [Marinilabiliaceae bacterium]
MRPNKSDELFMVKAIDLSEQNILKGGGPFAAIIVKNGEIIGIGTNRVTIDNDPTAHAEIMAIRDAANKLGTFKLEGCEIYTSCEPCPMCLGAIYWAGISTIFYGNTRKDAASIGFNDDFIYAEIDKPIEKRTIPFISLLSDKASIAFKMWNDMDNKTEY